MVSREKKTHYQILGVTADVSTDEIKRAYRRLAKLQHPDIKDGNGGSSEADAHEEMAQLNEAYATLMDRTKRAEYDCKIGLKTALHTVKPIFSSVEEDQEREKFLRRIFHPARLTMNKVLGKYQKQMRELSADPYDDELLEGFSAYVDEIEFVLRRNSEQLNRNEAPSSMEAAVHMMRNAIAQAADGLEELRFFCKNFDYDHLTMAENLFRIAADLSRQSLGLTKVRR